jgi:hypothetical protein
MMIVNEDFKSIPFQNWYTIKSYRKAMIEDSRLRILTSLEAEIWKIETQLRGSSHSKESRKKRAFCEAYICPKSSRAQRKSKARENRRRQEVCGRHCFLRNRRYGYMITMTAVDESLYWM